MLKEEQLSHNTSLCEWKTACVMYATRICVPKILSQDVLQDIWLALILTKISYIWIWHQDTHLQISVAYSVWIVGMITTNFSARFLALAFFTFLIVLSREPVHGKDTLTVINLYCPCVTGETDGRELFRLEFLQTLEERIKQLRVKRWVEEDRDSLTVQNMISWQWDLRELDKLDT